MFDFICILMMCLISVFDTSREGLKKRIQSNNVLLLFGLLCKIQHKLNTYSLRFVFMKKANNNSFLYCFIRITNMYFSPLSCRLFFVKTRHFSLTNKSNNSKKDLQFFRSDYTKRTKNIFCLFFRFRVFLYVFLFFSSNVTNIITS